jgi:putative membrane protein
MEAATLVSAAGTWGPGPWWPLFPILWFALFWGVLIFVAFRFRRGFGGGGGASAETVLAERYARGEIGVDEYRERLTVLKERAQ